MPVMAAVIVGYGLIKKAPVYDYFIEGAKEGLKTAVEIIPFMVGIYIAVNGLTVSGFLDFIYIVFKPLFSLVHIPVELLPLIFLRAVSGSGSFIILQNILEITGPDSFAGRAACSMSGGCETGRGACSSAYVVQKKIYLAPLLCNKGVRVSGGDLCPKVQKHRPSREARRC